MRIGGGSVWWTPNPKRFVESLFSTNTKCESPNRPLKQRKQSAGFGVEKYRSSQAKRRICNQAESRSQSRTLALDHLGLLDAIGESTNQIHTLEAVDGWTKTVFRNQALEATAKAKRGIWRWKVSSVASKAEDLQSSGDRISISVCSVCHGKFLETINQNNISFSRDGNPRMTINSLFVAYSLWQPAFFYR